jgi:hypothetical protein
MPGWSGIAGDVGDYGDMGDKGAAGMELLIKRKCNCIHFIVVLACQDATESRATRVSLETRVLLVSRVC